MRLVLALVLLPFAAAAQPMDLFGSGPRNIGMAGVQAAADDDFTAAYYNPALLWHGSVGAGFNWSNPSTFITPTSENVTGQQLTSTKPVDYAGITFGAAVPLIGELRDRVAVGINLFVPMRHVFRSHIIDEGTAYFLRYDNAPERFQLALAVCIRPTDWISIGAGAQVLSNYGGYAEFNTVLGMAGPGRIIRRRLDSEVTGVFGPTAGIAARPLKWLSVGGYWRAEMKTTFEQPILVDLGTFGSLDVLVRGVTQYSPHIFGLGVWGTFLDEKLTVGFDVTFENWAQTPPLVPDIHINLPQTLQDLGFNKEVLSREVAMGFSDILVPRFGLEFRALPRLALRAGWIYRSTPVPDQTERTNFLDSAAHIMSIGAGYRFDDPLRMADAIHVDIAGQLTAMSNREVVKSGPNNNPNYRFGGTNLLVNLGVKYQF